MSITNRHFYLCLVFVLGHTHLFMFIFIYDGKTMIYGGLEQVKKLPTHLKQTILKHRKTSGQTLAYSEQGRAKGKIAPYQIPTINALFVLF